MEQMLRKVERVAIYTAGGVLPLQIRSGVTEACRERLLPT
jgi:hypothetical protein